MKKGITIIFLIAFSVCKAQQQNPGTGASLTSAQLMQALQMDSSQYSFLKNNLRLFSDSITLFFLDSTIDKKIKLNSIALINEHQNAFLKRTLSPQQLASFQNFHRTRSLLSPRRRNE